MSETIETRPFVNLAVHHRVFAKGDIRAYLSWCGDNDEPCLVMIPSGYDGHHDVRRIKPCVIRLRDAWKWDENTGDGAYVAEMSVSFAIAMGFAASLKRALHITMIVRDLIGELLNMPVKPKRRVVVGDAIRRDQDGKEHHSEIVDDGARF